MGGSHCQSSAAAVQDRRSTGHRQWHALIFKDPCDDRSRHFMTDFSVQVCARWCALSFSAVANTGLAPGHPWDQVFQVTSVGSAAVQATSVLALSVVFTVQPVVSIRVSNGASIKIIVSDLGDFPCQFIQIILKTMIGIGW